MWTAFQAPLLSVPPKPPCGAICLQSSGWLSEAVAPWELQLRRYVWTDAGWKRSQGPMASRLWSKVLNAKPNKPLWPILQSMPPDVLELARSFGAWQHTAVELMALTPHARQLAETAPSLFWLVCAAWDTRSANRVRDAAIFQMKRVNLLTWALGFQAHSGQLELLERLHLKTRGRAEHALVRWVLGRPVQCGYLAGFKTICTHALKHVQAMEPEYLSPALGQCLASEMAPEHETLLEYRQTVRDIFRMADMLNIPKDHATKQVSGCETLADIGALHQTLQFRLQDICKIPCPHCNDDGDVSGMTCPICSGSGVLFKVSGSKPFPHPPVPGTAHIVHLPNAAALVAEGQEMHHCVASYAKAAAAGECFLYKVLAPERATLEVVLDASGAKHIAQVRGPFNSAVSSATHSALARWIQAGPTGQVNLFAHVGHGEERLC